MLITIKLEKSVSSIPELSRAIDAFEAIDEVYRLMKGRDVIRPEIKVDFRRKSFKDIKGGELDSFNIASPPVITINADNLWIAALLFILKDYSNAKNNLKEAHKDVGYLVNLAKTISDNEYQNAVIGARLFADKLSEIGEDNIKWLTKKLEVARRILHKENIKTIEVQDE